MYTVLTHSTSKWERKPKRCIKENHEQISMLRKETKRKKSLLYSFYWSTPHLLGFNISTCIHEHVLYYFSLSPSFSLKKLSSQIITVCWFLFVQFSYTKKCKNDMWGFFLEINLRGRSQVTSITQVGDSGETKLFVALNYSGKSV